MKALCTVIFDVVIICLHLSGSAVTLDAVKEIQSEKTEKMSLASLAGENFLLSIFNKESVYQSDKLRCNSFEEVKLNSGIGN